jgi:glycyl-tRNA synthetase
MNEAYTVETLENGSERTVMAFKPHLAPIKVAILPLKRNHKGIVSKAKAIKKDLMGLGLGRIFYEDTGNIGKGYRRHDEVGTPLCVTVDFQTIEEDDTVTVRNRDTMAQERVAIADLAAYVVNSLRG